MSRYDEPWTEWQPEPAGHMDPEDAIAAWMRARTRARSTSARRAHARPEVVTTQLEKEKTHVRARH